MTIIGLVLFIALLSTIGIDMVLSVFIKAQWIWLIPYLVVSFLIIMTLVLRWFLIITSHGYDVSLTHLFVVNAAGFATGYLSPFPLTGGEGARAFFLGKRVMPHEEALSTVIIDKSINETMNVVFSVIGVMLLLLAITIPGSVLLFVASSICLIALVLVLFYYRVLKGKGFILPILKFLGIFHKGFLLKYEKKMIETERCISRFFRKDRKTFLLTIALSLISWIFMFAEYKLLLLAFGYDTNLATIFLVIAVVAIAYITPVPAALGVLEGGQAALFSFTRMRTSDGVALGIIVRARDLVLTGIGLLYMINYGLTFRRK